MVDSVDLALWQLSHGGISLLAGSQPSTQLLGLIDVANANEPVLDLAVDVSNDSPSSQSESTALSLAYHAVDSPPKRSTAEVLAATADETVSRDYRDQTERPWLDETLLDRVFGR